MENAISIFISYDEDDETLAGLLKDFLEQVFLNAEVFVSGVDLSGGKVWTEDLRRKLSESYAIIALITPGSLHNEWVLFEAGAGFCAEKTIPVAAAGVTISSLKPPLSMLQSRAYDFDGIKQLVRDIANLAKVRNPDRLPGLEELISQANEFIKEQPGDENSIPPPQHQWGNPDPELLEYDNRLIERARTLMIRAIASARSFSDVPADDELQKMTLDELNEVADATQIKRPFLPGFNWLPHSNVPNVDSSKWKKRNAKRRLDDYNRELDEFEMKLDHRGY